ncbi:LOB domain-containing protein 24-like [Coffea eugenioides]|uniref:LOB domain-containing protein 24-like n=1 Tax=Coffea eugenioides TaxID=49369 RepID=UPI000F609FAA|nr:LOB domain-containing protein 24-like [Coffea eugenioides]
MFTGACAACKHQKKRCPPDCPLAPYFRKKDDFVRVHRLFGLNNVVKMLERVGDHERPKMAETIIMEAKIRRDNPVHGSLAVKAQLEAEIDACRKELDFVQKQLNFLKKATEINKEKEQLEAKLDKCPLGIQYKENAGEGSSSKSCA